MTIAQAKEQSAGIQVHCLRCAKVNVIGLERFAHHELIPDLARRYTFRCTRCGSVSAETRPDYPEFGGRSLTWYGLQKVDGD
ncbi:phage FluMu protein Com [Labrenzia sp. EL_208]|nr:phage FluMu protein Com [Labrenzia sp. EL_132]MBG6228163.1 phage FluMu protein Com [Labrenzia sp. EL_208]